MEKVTGKKVVFFPVQSNAAEIEAMRSGRLHIAGFNTGSNPIAVNCAGFVPFAIMAGKDGAFGYEMEIIVPADSAIKTPADIKGKKLAFTAPTSNGSRRLSSKSNLIAKRGSSRCSPASRQLSARRRQQDYDGRDRQRGHDRMFEHQRRLSEDSRLQVNFPDHRYGVALSYRPCSSQEPSLPSLGGSSLAEFKGRDKFVRSLTRKIGASSTKIDASGVKYSCK